MSPRSPLSPRRAAGRCNSSQQNSLHQPSRHRFQSVSHNPREDRRPLLGARSSRRQTLATRNQRQRSEPIARNPKLRLRNRARSAEFSAAASSRPTLPTQSPDASSLGALCIPLISYLACLDFYFDLLSSTFSAVGLPNVFELALKIAESSNRRHLF